MKTFKFAGALVAVCLAALLTAQCASRPSSAPQTGPVLPSLAQASQATEIHIQRIEEYGLSTRPWINVQYDLERAAGQFIGRAEFRVQAWVEPYLREGTADVVIPQDVAQGFLSQVAQIPLHEGVYEPQVSCTDCSRFSIHIELVLETGSITLFTESPSRERMQWAASIAGQTYLITSAAPMEALDLLRPYLKEEEIERLGQEGKDLLFTLPAHRLSSWVDEGG